MKLCSWFGDSDLMFHQMGLTCFRCQQTHIPPWVGICRGQRAIRSRGRGCGLSSKTRSCTHTLQVRWGLPVASMKAWCHDIIGPRELFNIHLTLVCYCVLTQDVAALESQPLLGFMLKVDSAQKLQFKLYHKNTLYYIFKADDIQTAQRYSIKSEAT